MFAAQFEGLILKRRHQRVEVGAAARGGRITLFQLLRGPGGQLQQRPNDQDIRKADDHGKNRELDREIYRSIARAAEELR
jgi:hypothetical protein